MTHAEAELRIEVTRLREQRQKAARLVVELESAALCALAAAGITTPAEGYAEAPEMMAAHIRRLAQQRDQAREQLGLAKARERRLREVLAIVNQDRRELREKGKRRIW